MSDLEKTHKNKTRYIYKCPKCQVEIDIESSKSEDPAGMHRYWCTFCDKYFKLWEFIRIQNPDWVQSKEESFLPRKILEERHRVLEELASTCKCGAKTLVGEDATLLYTCHTCGGMWDYSQEDWDKEHNFYEAYYELKWMYDKLHWNLVDFPKKILELFDNKGGRR